MKTDAKEKDSKVDEVAVKVLEDTHIDPEEIEVAENQRKRFDEKKIKEMADSMKQVGVLQPLIVRKVKTGIQLIAGERRLRAAMVAGLAEVPVRIVQADDLQAARIQALENLHRQDLTPIEEARAFKTLMEKGGYTVEDLAQRVDKSTAYVYRAVRLIELPMAAVDAIDQGKLTAAHGHQLLRIESRKVQEEMIKEAIEGEYTARELKEEINRNIGRNLDEAPFHKDKPIGTAPACVGCRFNSGEQGDLFDGVEKGRCTGPGCYDAKVEAYVKGIVEDFKAKNPKMKFLGANESRYEIKHSGMEQVTATPAVRSIMAKQPEIFAWAVIQTWEGSKKIWKVIYFTKLTPAIRKASGQQSYSSSSESSTPERAEYVSRMEAVQQLVNAAVRKAYWDKTPKMPSAKDLLSVIEESEIDAVCQVLQILPAEIEAWPAEKLIKLLWFVRATEIQYSEIDKDWEKREKEAKLDRKGLEKKIKEAAAKVWPMKAQPTCKICGCKPHNGCSMEKNGSKYGRTCWWKEPGICSKCQKDGKTLADVQSASEKIQKKPAKAKKA